MTDLTHSDIIDLFEMNDEIEITAVVKQTEAVRTVGRVRRFTLFKFVLDNLLGKQIQVCAWGDASTLCAREATLNTIIRLEGARTKLIDGSQKAFNSGNVPFELHVNGNTIVENLGKHADEVTEAQQEFVDKTWEEISSCVGSFVALEGFIKTVFRASQINGRAGSIATFTDGHKKMVIKVLSGDGLMDNLERGVPIMVRGQVLEEPTIPNRLFMKVASGATITRSRGNSLEVQALARVTMNVQKIVVQQ